MSFVTSLYKRLPLRSRLFVFLGLLVLAGLGAVWFLIRPQYERSLIEERLAIVQQLQFYAIETGDEQLGKWINETRYTAMQLPAQAGTVDSYVRFLINFYPDIIQIRITAAETHEFLMAENPLYRRMNVPFDSLRWVPSKTDSLVLVAWYENRLQRQSTISVQSLVRMQNARYTLIIVFDGNTFVDRLQRFGLGEESIAALHDGTDILFANQAGVREQILQSSSDKLSRLKQTTLDGTVWDIISSEFRSVPFRLVFAVKEEVVLQPVRRLLATTLSLMIVFGVLALVIGWFGARVLVRPIRILIEDVKRLSELDFSKPVRDLDLPDLAPVGATVESMRQVLERYQRINVEKIIFEEWKNRLFMSHSEDMIGLTDGNGEFVFKNDRFAELCAEISGETDFRTKEQLLAHPAVTLLRESPREETYRDLRMHFVQAELRITAAEGAVHYFRVHDCAIRNADGDLGSLVVFHDLTTERQMEQMKADMMNIIVHELRNPVANILGAVKIVIDFPDMEKAEKDEFLQIVERSGQDLKQLINRLLDIQRLESGRIEHPKTECDLKALTDRIIGAHRAQLAQKNLTVSFAPQEERMTAVASEDLMKEAFSNLLSNAIKYGEPGRTIEIALTRSDATIAFVITDHGYGIAPKDQEKLFTKFYRVTSDPNVRKQTGTGLGLAYVKQIMTHHQGTITLESTPAIGCRFTLHIPVHQKPAAQHPAV